MTTDQRRSAPMAPAPTGETMRAVVQDGYGDADVLRLEVVPRPVVGPQEVLVRVQAAGVDRGAWHLMTGLPYPVRLAGYGVRRPKSRVRGREVAGQVAAVGDDVTRFAVGDQVLGVAEGCFAEHVSAREDRLVLRPANLTPVQAAAAPVSGLTALQAVRDQGKVQPGQQVLVVGASGGVGSFAVQIATALGARVTGVCSAGKVDLVRSLGAVDVLDYAQDEFPTDHAFDVVIDTGGNRALRQLRRALTPSGTLVIVGAETGGRWLGGVDRQLRAMVLSPFLRQRLGSFLSSEGVEDLQALADLLASGAVTPAVDRTWPLEGVADAMRHLVAGRAAGKLVIEL